MVFNHKLTERGVSKLMRGEELDKPIFQILGFKKIAGQGGSDRYRLNISDGTHSHTFAMLATQLNHMIPDGQLDNFCVIRADKIVSNAVSEKRVLIILELTVLATGTEMKVKIGNPVQFVEGGSASQADTSHAGSNLNRPFRVQESAGHADRPTPNPRKWDTGFGSDSEAVMPIRDINPYNSSKIGVKVRVTNKGQVKTWSNSRGEGKLFSMDLLDDSGEIRMTAFNQQVDQMYELIKVGCVYTFRNFSVKSANKNFSTLNNDYELSANQDTQFTLCTDAEASDIPVVSYEFVEIANIEVAEKDRIIDVIGVCKKIGDLQTFTARTTNKELTKRDIVLVDKTNREINLTLWGKQAEDFQDDSNPVVAVKGAKVSDYNGKSISCMMSSSMLVNPDIPEAHVLRGWYDNVGLHTESHSLSMSRAPGGTGTPWKLIREANTMNNPAAQDKGDYYMCKTTIVAIKRDNAMYRACPGEKCNKKVIDGGNGFFRCEKCNKESSDFKWRAMANVNFADCSSNVWATCFQETAEIVFGLPSETLGPISNDDPDQFDGIIKDAAFKSYIVKFRCKMETYNSENRLKHSVLELHPVNYAEYAKKLLNEIKECAPA
ncbi:replication protein A 70 kDa DNA-binding subunit isoform X2 [Folsomia candida]|uniref:replication protein A 70 kDa DNA-binding subunit isoform X2 n=1 Tax=Folsomia candida TaxID=158441 RepID=UPI000B9092E3|nr:replication protein A 70 kDa DNA-binding subunit isoform X2 [Folsomia candida]